jgi:predicted dehydrogenase
MKPLKVGIAGAARGAGFVTGVEAMPDAAVLHAVYDPSESARTAFAHAHGVEHAVDSFGQLLDLCDLVVVSSPQHHHAPQAIAALEAGVHVLSEVPAVVSLEQADDLVAATRRSGAAYAMAENYCYTRSNLVVRAMAREGMFGELYYGEGEYLHEMKGYHTTPDGSPTWRYHWQVGRDGFTYPTHSLGPLLQWFDDRVVSVSCVGSGRHTDPEHEIQDSIVMLARTRNGALLRTRLDLLSNRPHLMDYYSLQGTKGAFEAPRTPGAGHVVHLRGVSPADTWEPLDNYVDRFLPKRYAGDHGAAGHWGADRWPIQDFVDSIHAGERSALDVYRALDMTLPGVMSERSIAQGGAWIAVPNPRFATAGIGVDPGSEAPLA